MDEVGGPTVEDDTCFDVGGAVVVPRPRPSARDAFVDVVGAAVLDAGAEEDDGEADADELGAGLDAGELTAVDDEGTGTLELATGEEGAGAVVAPGSELV